MTLITGGGGCTVARNEGLEDVFVDGESKGRLAKSLWFGVLPAAKSDVVGRKMFHIRWYSIMF